MNRIPRFFFPAFLTATLLWVYGSTLAPGLTWAHNGADGGDLITATMTGGVPHPTGYPLYLLLAGFFQRLPVGPLAFRTNLFSAIAMTGAALLIYLFVARTFSGGKRWTGVLAGLSSAFSFALAPMVWSQAVITEVYALHALFIVAILYLSSGLVTRLSEPQLDRLTGLVCGLAIGNHLTSIFLLPLVLVWKRNFPSIMRRISFIIIGLLPYLILPLRASSHAPVNWGDASTWDGFLWLVSGRLYQDELFSLTGLWARTQASASLLLEQFGMIGLLLAFTGMVLFSPKTRIHWNLLWVTICFSVFSIFYGTRDSQVYLIPVFLCFAVWIGIALGRLMETRPGGRFMLAGLFAAWLVFSAIQTWPRVDLSQDVQAEEFGESVLAQTPQGAILFAKGDEAVFTLWYFHYALVERPDVVVIATDLLHFDWYQRTLRVTYPALVVPGPLPFGETVRLANPDRAACFVEYPQESKIECLEVSR